MKLTKCVNGHFYDEEKFEGCPHCAGGSKLDVNAIFGGAPSAPKPAMSKVERDDDMTVPLEWTPAETPAAKAPAVESVSPVAAETPVTESVSSAATEIPVTESVLSAATEIPAAESVSSAATEIPATESVSPVAAETPATESVSSAVTEIPATESVSSVATEIPVTESASSVATEIPATDSVFSMASAGSSVDTAESSAEGETGNVEPVVDIHSQPSFDTPLDFDADFTKGEGTVDEDGPTEEPEEEFELLSKFHSDHVDDEESEVTIEPEPFVVPEPKAYAAPEAESAVNPEPFAAPETESAVNPEPFVVSEPEAVTKPEPFVTPEPEAASEPGPFVTPETVQAAWKMPQPNVEEIPTGDSLSISPAVDPELEDQPTEIVDELEMELVNGIKGAPAAPAPSPAAAMFGASVNDEDDEHTVAFYDEIFVSKAPAAPVVPGAEIPTAAAPIPGTPVAQPAPVSEPAAQMPGDTAKVPEPDVFTAPPLQPVQVLPTPCVGWLIALNGSHIGQDFHLRVGKNYIGRDAGMDIVLSGDKSVSRNKHAIVIYEPKHHKYFIQPGESNELVYVNDEVVLLPMPLKAYDVIVIGDIELWFMPLCDDQHNWSEVIRRLQEHM